MIERAETVQVTVIGLGLMGGSFAAALMKAGGWHITGYDALDAAREKAVSKGYVDQVAPDLASAVADAKLVVLATPVQAIIDDVRRIGSLLPEGAIVMDLGSTKAQINQAMDSLPSHVSAIGGHPMAGKKTSGVDRADATLYADRKFILVPNTRTDEAALAIGKAAIADIGAQLVMMESEHHDRVVAMVSHLPHFLSIPILRVTESFDDPLVWQLAAGGFQQVTEPAAENQRMWTDIAQTNGAVIADLLRKVSGELQGLAKLFETGDDAAIEQEVAHAKDLRDSYFPPVTVETTPGLRGMVRTYGALGSAGSWSHAAGAWRYPNADRIGAPSFDALAKGCVDHEYDLAVFPIHNTTTGEITGVAEAIAKHNLRRVGETVISIQQCLVTAPAFAERPVAEGQIARVFSHSQGFSQCAKYLSENYPNAEMIKQTDTASGIRHVMAEARPNQLAIGSAFAAEIYGAHILEDAINDAPDNETRFVFCVKD